MLTKYLTKNKNKSKLLIYELESTLHNLFYVI